MANGVHRLGVAGEGLGEALARLGSGIANFVDPERERRMAFEAALAENPELALALAQSQRRMMTDPETAAAIGDARSDVEVPNVLAPFGLRRGRSQDLALELSQLPPTFEQEVESEVRERGGVSTSAERIVQENRHKGETARLGADTAEAMSEAGIAQITANLEQARGNLQIKKTEFGQQMQEELERRFPTMDPRLRLGLVAATANPEFLRDIQHLENLSLEEMLMRLRLASTQRDNQLETLTTLLALGVKTNEEVDRLRQNIENAEGRDAILDAIRRYNNFNNLSDGIWTALGNAGIPIGQQEFAHARLRDRRLMPDVVETGPLRPVSVVDHTARAIVEGRASLEDFVGTGDLTEEQEDALEARVEEYRAAGVGQEGEEGGGAGEFLLGPDRGEGTARRVGRSVGNVEFNPRWYVDNIWMPIAEAIGVPVNEFLGGLGEGLFGGNE